MLNKVILMGRITAAPELKSTPSGVAVTSFTLAVDRVGKEKVTDFLNIVAWRSTAEFVCKYFEKGSPIVVEGSLQSRSYTTKDGQKRTAFEVVADSVGFVPAAAKREKADEQPSAEAMPSAEEFAEIMGNEEDLPF
jgi:single-strand DNA-binding protein